MKKVWEAKGAGQRAWGLEHGVRLGNFVSLVAEMRTGRNEDKEMYFLL